MTASFRLELSVTDNSKIKTQWDLQGDLNGELSFEDMIKHFRAGHIGIAKTALKQEQATGFDKDPRVRVDNKFDRDEFDLKPFGKIEYFAKVFAPKVLLELYSEIEKRSPRRTGTYSKHNYVFYNSKLVARNLSELKVFLEGTIAKGFKDGDKLRFMNVTPYSARAEIRGVATATSGRMKGKIKRKQKFVTSRSSGKTIKKPNGTYALAARSFRNKLKATGIIKHEFIPNGHAGIFVKSDSKFRNTYANTRKNRAKRRVGKPYVYSSILITLSEKGVILQ